MTVSVRAFVTRRETRPDLLALGEPAPSDPAFPRLRNEIFKELVEEGFRSIALDCDPLSGLAVDAHVREGRGTLDAVLGAQSGNRELLSWMLDHNSKRSRGERLAFYGFGTPPDSSSPRPYLDFVRDYLAAHLEQQGADDVDDRVRADDLRGVLEAYAPRLVAASSLADWRRAVLNVDAAQRVLRARAAAAEPDSLRDAWMAHNLLDIRVREQHRGPTLVFGQNQHLRRDAGAGAVVATLLADRYAVVLGSVGSNETISAPDGTFEAALSAAAPGPTLFEHGQLLSILDDEELVSRSGQPALDWPAIARTDALLHLP